MRNPPPGLSPEPNAELVSAPDDPIELVLAVAAVNELSPGKPDQRFVTRAPRQGSAWPGWNAYSITSSARARMVWGTTKPRSFAVLRLMTNSNLVGCSTGRSAGFAPFRILST